MNRLQKKCVIGSVGAHLLLLCILFVGPAFLAPSSKLEHLPVVDFIPSKLVDAAITGGGSPNAGARSAEPPAPPVAPPPVAPPVQTPPKPDPTQRLETAQVPPKRPSESLETAAKKQPRVPKINTDLVVRKSDNAAAKARAEAKERDQRLAEARRVAGRLASAADRIREGTSSATTIETDFGPGGGGPSYASYAGYVKSVYENAWIAPEDSATDDAVTQAKIIIARDGKVVLARIAKPSGDAQVDASVQRVLDRIKFIAPFPEGAKDQERTYYINFNLKAKRGLA